MKTWTLFAATLLTFAVTLTAHAQPKYPERWNFAKASLGDDAGLATFLDILQQSKDVGCTHIMMPEGRWLTMSEDPAYLARVAKAKAKAKELNLSLVPVVYSLGYSGRYLVLDPNLAAGMPVREMPFVVTGKTAAPEPVLVLGGTLGLKSETGPVVVLVKVRPFNHYRISFTTPASAADEGPIPVGERRRRGAQVSVNSTVPGRQELTRRDLEYTPKGDIKLAETTFNSLEAGEVKITIRGDVQNLKIEPAGLLGIVRRDLVPLKVTSEDGQTVYKEGVDFKPVSDPKMHADGEYNFNHEAPVLALTDNTSIKPGQKLLVSFWHAYRLGSDQDIISMEDPKVFDIMDRDIQSCLKVWNPTGFFMNYDEFRIAGWENQPDGQKRTPGQELAAHVKKGYDIIKKNAPTAKVYTWSDMFTPFHNARPIEGGGYYLVNGDWNGSWEGLPSDVIIMMWSARDAAAINFFADRGNQQIICGYYDRPATNQMKSNIARWIAISRNSKGILGFMYTPWERDRGPMKEYFQLLDTYDQWSATAKTMPARN